MRFSYSTTEFGQDELDRLPRLPLRLSAQQNIINTIGLVDSGAMVNVLPYELGLRLGGVWNKQQAIIQLAGNLGRQMAIPFFAMGYVGEFSPVRLAFAWTRVPNTPLILGQTNFFMEFEVCFFRPRFEFEIRPKNNLGR